MKEFMKISPLLVVVVMLLSAGCASTKKSKTAIPNYVGKWTYVLSLPDGDFDGFVRFVQEGENTMGFIGNAEGEAPLENLIVDEEKVSANFDYQGYTVNLSGNFTEDVLDGKMEAAGYEFPFKAQKQAE